MSNSGLVSYTCLSPNHYSGRRYPITKITPHYMGGNCTVETCGAIFKPASRRASSNYGIGSDGRVALYVDEANAPWTSGNYDNDNRAVTIEVANLGDSSITDAAWSSLVALCVDICRRNGIGSLNYTGSVSGNLTMHCWFQDTSCPGSYLKSQFARLAREVNAKLAGGDAPSVKPHNNTQGGKLDVDGIGGYNTILDWQHALGTYEDGVVSGQWLGNKAYLAGIVSVEWGAQGSQLVRAIQARVGAGVDGIWGQETSRKAQVWLIDHGYKDSGADGYFGEGSVRALQRSLNDGVWS